MGLRSRASGALLTPFLYKVILGKEISRSVRCLKNKTKTQTFRVYDPSSGTGHKVHEGVSRKN